MPTQAGRRPPSLAWGCSIRGLLLTPGLALLLTVGVAGCTRITQANANIAFMGDSITALWWLPKSNLGVSGNTTAQMLDRLPGEIQDYRYDAMVILAGTNDVRVVTTPIGEEVDSAISNIEQMAVLAEGKNIEVVLCLIPPIRGEDTRVNALNAAITTLAQQHQYKLVDYYTPMVNHPEYFRDGEHPNDEGYFVMQAALTKVIPLDY